MTTATAPRVSREILEDRMAGLWDEPDGTGTASELWSTLYGAVCDLVEGVARIDEVGSRGGEVDSAAQDLVGHIMNTIYTTIIDGVDSRGIATPAEPQGINR